MRNGRESCNKHNANIMEDNKMGAKERTKMGIVKYIFMTRWHFITK